LAKKGVPCGFPYNSRNNYPKILKFLKVIEHTLKNLNLKFCNFTIFSNRVIDFGIFANPAIEQGLRFTTR